MSKIHCLYCGEEIPDDVEHCPECGAPSHYQKRGVSLSKQKKFIIYFIALIIFVAVMIIWLPR
ncbi:MAG: zinc-ribbon domain-containing protein [Gammaproteobacteria bacterium]|nr:zinc-ribbon domain-containing protein [Gammaproteobacteria bacterium]